MSDIHKVSLAEEKETLLMTLQAKALDSRAPKSILNDKRADEIIRQIDYDFNKLNGFGNDLMVVRAKQLDVWIEGFLDANPTGAVLNLGCGLDTRASRLNLPASVLWFDVDFPDVIDLRMHFFPPRVGYEMISTTVTEPGWLEGIPRDRPVMIVAEGLLEYLSEDEVRALLNRLTGYFPYGQIAFDVMNSLAVTSGRDRLQETTGAVHKWTVDDVRDVDKLDSKLKRVENISIFQSKYMRRVSLKMRLSYRAMCLIPSFRNMMRVLLYKF